MNPSRSDPRWVPRWERSDGLTLARQAPPPAARTFAATFLARAGSAYDPVGRRGLAVLTSRVLPSGGGRRDRRALALELDRLGASLTTRCDPETMEVRVHGPQSAFRPLLDLLGDVVLAPRFDEEDLERVRRQMHESQLREMAQPDQRADRELLRAIFARGHPYRESGLGTRAEVDRIGIPEVRSFLRDHFTSGGSSLVVTAPCPPEALERASRRAFPKFVRESPPANPTVPRTVVRRPPDPQHIDLPGRAQVEIRIGGPTIARSDPRYDAAYLANEILGGRPMLARLFQRAREQAGLVYHASSELEAMGWGGHWTARAGTGPVRAEAVVRLLEREVAAWREVPPTAAVLDEIRESALGELPVTMEKTRGAHDLAVAVTYYRLPEDELLARADRLRSIGPRQVRDAARIAFDPGTGVTIVAGPPSPARSPARGSGTRDGRGRLHTHK